MNRLETIANIWKSPPDDDGHGVVEVGGAHFLFDIDRQKTPSNLIQFQSRALIQVVFAVMEKAP